MNAFLIIVASLLLAALIVYPEWPFGGDDGWPA